MPKLYHCKRSRSMRPLWALEELGIKYELITMKFPPRVNYDGYLEINPLGTVPTFVDGQTTPNRIYRNLALLGRQIRANRSCYSTL